MRAVGMQRQHDNPMFARNANSSQTQDVSSSFYCGNGFTAEMKWHFHSKNSSESMQILS
jgi:hypothetical protein